MELNRLMRHDWIRMQAPRAKVLSCRDCGMLREKMPGSRGGYTRFVDAAGSCHDSFTVDETSCEGPPANYGLR